eukprot:9467143-Alexandrium_andersonii.AAC.1
MRAPRGWSPTRLAPAALRGRGPAGPPATSLPHRRRSRRRTSREELAHRVGLRASWVAPPDLSEPVARMPS